MTETENRKRFLTNTTYIVVLLGLYYLFMTYALGLLFPFLFAVAFAMAMQKPIRFLAKKTRMKKSLASVLCVLGVLLAVLGLISLIGVKVVSEVRGLFDSLTASFDDLPSLLSKTEAALVDAIRFLPTSLEKSAGTAITGFFDKLNSKESFKFDFSTLLMPLGGVWSTAKQVPSIFVSIIVSIVSCFFMTSDYDRIVNFIKRQMPAQKSEALATSKKIMISSMGKLGKTYLILMFITFCEILLGLNLFRLIGIYESSYLLATALLISLVDILPFLGTGTILIPWAVYALIMGNTGLGIALFVLYGVIYVIRQAIEPKLVASNLGLPPVLTIMGMYIGGKLFGFFGLFLVPLSIIFVKILNDEGILNLWKNIKVSSNLPPAKQEEDPSAEKGGQKTEEEQTVPAKGGKG